MADNFRLLPSPAYKISKAALNMLTVQYAKQYANDGFTFLGISPGVGRRHSLSNSKLKLFANTDSGFVRILEALVRIFQLN